MRRLIERGLMFGNLVEVAAPVLVERYNRALRHLTGLETALTSFHIDISGFSPEIADELGDPLYLNPEGVNRQFILLGPEQKSAPLLGARFSTTRGMLRAFIAGNEAALFALTARDVVAGEMVNTVLLADHPRRLFEMGQIEIEADTVGGTLAKAEDLAALIDRFQTVPDAWADDALIARMIALAGETGDLIRNPLELRHQSYRQRSFWTALFGGLYLVQDVPEPAVLSVGPKAALGALPLPVIGMGERTSLAKWLNINGLVEPIVKARGVDAAAILRQKMDFLIVDAASDTGMDLSRATRQDLRRLARRHAADLPEAYHGLAALLRWSDGSGEWPRITSEHPAYFYTLRAADTPHAELVNRLLAELAPKDVRQLFICHKELFYHLYSGWSETKKSYVAEFLLREYQTDKAGAREALFGHEPPMETPTPEPVDIIARVGPWGAVGGR